MIIKKTVGALYKKKCFTNVKQNKSKEIAIFHDENVTGELIVLY